MRLANPTAAETERCSPTLPSSKAFLAHCKTPVTSRDCRACSALATLSGFAAVGLSWTMTTSSEPSEAR